MNATYLTLATEAMTTTTWATQDIWGRQAFGIIAAVCLVYFLLTSGRREKGLPPGPPTIPIFGNLLQLSSFIRISDFALFQDLGKTFGSLISIKLANQTAIILQDDGTAMRELFEKRGAEYSRRPCNSVANLVGRRDHAIFEQDPQKIRVNRKLIIQHFSAKMSQNVHVHIQEAESTQLLDDLFKTPEKFEEHFLRFTVSVLLSVAYGYRTSTCDHVGVVGLREVLFRWLDLYRWNVTPPLDIWPWLNLVPDFLAPWRKASVKVASFVDEVYTTLLQPSLEMDARGLIDDSFAHKLFLEKDALDLTDHRIMMLLSVVLEGGSEILANTLSTAVMALLVNPDVQAKAQAEIDSICDSETVPNWSHWEQMAYTRSVGKETMRWRPPFPLGVPRMLEHADVFQGYNLPEKSIVLPNIWAVHHNPARYPEPEKFKPERFLNHTQLTGEYLAHSDHHERDHYGFGAGRRHCPGVYMAEQAQFLVIARILWAFNLKPVPGTSIEDIDTDGRTGFIGGAVRRPKKFNMIFEPRSEKKAQLVSKELGVLHEGFFQKYAGGEDLPVPKWTP